MPDELTSDLEIFAGIHDGNDQYDVVPISHSIKFFNKLCAHGNNETSLIDGETENLLLTRAVKPLEDKTAEGRDILFHREALFSRHGKKVSLTIFDGVHEALATHCFVRMKSALKH